MIVPRVGQPPFLRGQAVVALDTKERETVQFLGNEPRSGSKTTTTHGPDFALHSVRRSFTRIHAIVGSGEFHRGGSPLNDPPLARAGRDAVGDSKAMRCDRQHDRYCVDVGGQQDSHDGAPIGRLAVDRETLGVVPVGVDRTARSR